MAAKNIVSTRMIAPTSSTRRRRYGAASSELIPVGLVLKRERVDAPAQAGRRRPIREDVPQVRVAGRAQRLLAGHAVGGVALDVDRVLGDRLEEARPAGAGLELRVRAEQLGPARRAPVQAGRVQLAVLAGERPLGRLLA